MALVVVVLFVVGGGGHHRAIFLPVRLVDLATPAGGLDGLQ